MSNVTLRDASEQDVPLILAFTKKLAEFERGVVTATEADMHARFFGPHAIAKGIVAELDGKPVGSALYYFAFSSYAGRPVLALEDIYVDEAARGAGVGKKLMAELAARAVEAGCMRMQWSAMKWNQSAIDVYEHLGAKPTEGIVYFKFDDEAMAALAAEAERGAER